MNNTITQKITAFFSQFPLRTYAKGEIIIIADNDPAGIFFLQDGIVEQYDITQQGNKITVNIYKPHAFFPMSWAINNVPNTYFFSASTDVSVRCADAHKTVEFVRSNPDVLFDLLGRVYKGTDALLRKAVVASGSLASTKLIVELLIESYRFGRPTTSDSIAINVQQRALASRSGLARETVSRELHKLESLSLVSLEGKDIIFNVNTLEKFLSSHS